MQNDTGQKIEKPEPGSPRRYNSLLFALPALLTALIAVAVLLGHLDHELSVDGFYNARLAQSGPSVYWGHRFPWLEVSVLNQWYADKELLYHTVLDGIFRVMEHAGLSLNPPFRIPLFCFATFFLVCFLAAAKQLGVRNSLLIPGALFAVFLCSAGTVRLFMLRSHVFSAALLCIMIFLLARRPPGKRTFLYTAALSFLYAWSYSIPFFILIVPCAFAFFRSMKKGGAAEWLFPVWSAAGVLSGMILHPQFPANLLILWRQGFHAMFAHARGATAAYLAPAEMNHLTIQSLPGCWQVFLLVALAAVSAAFWAWRRKPVTDPDLYAVGAMALCFTAGMFHATRSVEYAMPVVSLFFIAAAEAHLRQTGARTADRLLPPLLAGFALLLTCLHVRKAASLRTEFPEPVNLCAYLRDNIPPGISIYNPIWGDFPRLYFYDPLHVWQWGIDPVLSLGTDQKKYDMLVRCIHPTAPCPTQKEASNVLRTPLAVVLYPSWQAAKHFADNGWIIHKQFMEEGREEGWIFFYPDKLEPLPEK